MTTTYRCDLCGAEGPTFMFAHGYVDCSKLLYKVFETGYFATCAECADLIEMREFERLADRALARSEKAKIAPCQVLTLIRAELLRLYSHISTQRQRLPSIALQPEHQDR